MSQSAAVQVLRGAVAFTDLVGYTEYTAVRGDLEALELLARQDALVREVLPASARLVKELGDGLLLWFPDADAALLTCLELQVRFEAEAARSGLPLWVRIGLHWGSQTERGDDIIGHDVNVAARIVGVAGPGEVLLSEPSRGCLTSEAGLGFDELGPVVMKGLPEPVRLFRAWRDPTA
jgi:adenylate cyclase